MTNEIIQRTIIYEELCKGWTADAHTQIKLHFKRNFINTTKKRRDNNKEYEQSSRSK